MPKRSLTNSAAERVDVRVLQVIYALPQTADAPARAIAARGDFVEATEVGPKLRAALRSLAAAPMDQP